MARMKTWSIMIGTSAIAGAALGAWGMSAYKDAEKNKSTLAERALGETRLDQAKAKFAPLEQRLARARVQMELGRVLVEAERRNFGLAQDRLKRVFEQFEKLAGPGESAYGRAVAALLEKRAEITAGLESGDPGFGDELRRAYAELHNAL